MTNLDPDGIERVKVRSVKCPRCKLTVMVNPEDIECPVCGSSLSKPDKR